ncbi:MAG: RNA 2',3'-cyclic phosphodiesterase [Gammaproteobacteria bacterium]|nr:RNA 2',3'-cyclic phosphodiesterase [Gammaproteobacteria bacterium]
MRPLGREAAQASQHTLPLGREAAKGEPEGVSSGNKRRRLFFALWPDEETRHAIYRATGESVRRVGGRPVPAENWHLTLAFLGSRPESLLPALCDAAGQLEPPGGTLGLERLGHFARARVLWLGPRDTPHDLRHFVDGLWNAIEPLGIERERRAFAAHLTLARKIHRLPCVAVEPVVWRYAGFSLVESVTDPRGARYEVLQNWPAVK